MTDLIARGAYGKVFAKNRHQVVKVVSLFDYRNQLELSVIREILFFALVRHGVTTTHLVQAECSIADDNKHAHMVMPRAACDLHTWITKQTQPLEPSMFVNIACQLMTALWTLHNLGVAHCDLKPGNVLVYKCPDGNLTFVLADYNTFEFLDKLSDVSLATCTVSYRAPETFAQDIETCEKDKFDRFSLGAVLMFVATKQNPFSYPNLMSLEKQVKMAIAFYKTEPLSSRFLKLTRFNQKIPRVYREIVADLLHEDPNARPTLSSCMRRIGITPTPDLNWSPPSFVKDVAAFRATPMYQELLRVCQQRKQDKPTVVWASCIMTALKSDETSVWTAVKLAEYLVNKSVEDSPLEEVQKMIQLLRQLLTCISMV
jgi:serine/threonine protein kinase